MHPTKQKERVGFAHHRHIPIFSQIKPIPEGTSFLSVGFPLHRLLRHEDHYFCNHLKILMLLKNAPLGTSLAFIISINHISHKTEPTEIRGKAWDRTINRQATGLQ